MKQIRGFMSEFEQKKTDKDAFILLCIIIDAYELNDVKMVLRKVKNAEKWLKSKPRAGRKILN